MTQPIDFYVVTTWYPDAGPEAGDATPSFDIAYDQYAEWRHKTDNPVWVVQVDVAFGVQVDVTFAFEQAYKDICRTRRLDYEPQDFEGVAV
jgi:hypothetical protein